MLNFSIAYGKTAVGLSQDWNVWASICTGFCMHLSSSLFSFSCWVSSCFCTQHDVTQEYYSVNVLLQSVQFQSCSLLFWQVEVREARDTLKLWYRDRKEVSAWQKKQKAFALEKCEVYTLLGRSRQFPNMTHAGPGQKGHVERAAINAPVQVIPISYITMVVLVQFWDV